MLTTIFWSDLITKSNKLLRRSSKFKSKEIQSGFKLIILTWFLETSINQLNKFLVILLLFVDSYLSMKPISLARGFLFQNRRFNFLTRWAISVTGCFRALKYKLSRKIHKLSPFTQVLEPKKVTF